MVCGKITNLTESLKAMQRGKNVPFKTCRKKAVYAAKIGRKTYTYCAQHFLSHWLRADISAKVKLL